jgi:hypothetical protein
MTYLKMALISFNLTVIMSVLARSNYRMYYLLFLVGFTFLMPGIYGYLKFETKKYFLYSIVAIIIYLVAVYLGLKL